MIQGKLLPSEYLEFSIETYLNRLMKKSHYLSTTSLFFLLLAVFCMFFLKINQTVQGKGEIRNVSKSHEILSPVSGTISQIFVKNNSNINVNQPIVTIKINSFQNNKYLEFYLNNIFYTLNNIKALIQLDNNRKFKNIETYSQESISFKFRERLKIQRLDVVENYNDFIQNTIPWYFDKKFDKRKVHYTYDNFSSYFLVQYQNNISIYNILFQELTNYYKKSQHDIKLYTIKSPFKGKIGNVADMKIGLYINTGSRITNIFYDTKFIVTINLSSKNIKKLSIGDEAQIYISEFQNNNTISIKSKVAGISDYSTFIEGQLYHKIFCDIDEKFLAEILKHNMYSKQKIPLKAEFSVKKCILFNYIINNIINQ